MVKQEWIDVEVALAKIVVLIRLIIGQKPLRVARRAIIRHG